MPLKIEASAFNFTLPVFFLPDLSAHKEFCGKEIAYAFSYSFDVLSSERITYLSTPSGSLTEQTPRGFRVIQPESRQVPQREVKVFFRTENMLLSSIKYQRKDGEVACMACVAPTFVQPVRDQTAELTNEQPDEVPVSDGADFHFIFLVDRSGSMEGLSIEITKEALSIFLRSLPPDCNFSILSFGDHCKFSEHNGKTTIPYSDAAIASIDE